MLFIGLTFEEQRVFMLSDMWGKAQKVKGNKKNMVGGCYVVLSKMLTGSAARLPFHLVFHL